MEHDSSSQLSHNAPLDPINRQAVGILLRIGQISGSNVGLQADYPDVFVVCLSPNWEMLE
jgi:hypothetical protein